MLIATPEHWSCFGERLAESGWNAARIEESGLLFCADADTTLAAIMDGDRPSADRFDAVVGGLLDRVGARFPQRRIRAFGEMVDLLCERGEPDRRGAAGGALEPPRAAAVVLAPVRLPRRRLRP